MENNTRKGSDSLTFDLVPEEGEFKCTLDKGTASICTYWNRFEVNMDMANFSRENTKITISQNGTICISCADSAQINFDKIIQIPSAERETVLKNGFICQMNSNGVLRIYASLLQPTTKAEIEMTSSSNGISLNAEGQGQTKTKKRWTISSDIEGNTVRSRSSSNDAAEDSKGFQFLKTGPLKFGDGKGRIIPLKPVIESSVKRVKTAVATPWGQRVAAKNISVEKQFKKGAKFEANVAAKDYAAKEIKISIGVGWITITGKKQPGLGGDPSAFTKKIEIPPHINPECLTFSLDTSNGSINISVMD